MTDDVLSLTLPKADVKKRVRRRKRKRPPNWKMLVAFVVIDVLCLLLSLLALSQGYSVFWIGFGVYNCTELILNSARLRREDGGRRSEDIPLATVGMAGLLMAFIGLFF